MDLSEFEARCGACAGLCCMAFDFDAGDRFPIDKPAGTPCPHLSGHACGIYGARARHGFAGCRPFDCRGAGQAVTQALFDGRSWRDEPALTTPMAKALDDMFAVQETRFMLTTMEFAGLPPARERERKALLAALDPGGSWTAARLAVARDAVAPAQDWMARPLSRAEGAPGGVGGPR